MSRQRKPSRTSEQRAQSWSSVLAIASVFALLLFSITAAAAADPTICSSSTICKPGYAKRIGTTAVCTTDTAVHETGGCQECCAAAAYACSDTTCSTGFTNIGGYVTQCDACPGTLNSCSVASSGPTGCSACCQARTCPTGTICAFGYRNIGSFSPSACTACSSNSLKCSNAGGCQECCQPAASIFPTCQASLGSSPAQQALTANDATWAVRSTAPFVRHTDTHTGMCFSINLRNACAGRGSSSELQQACCLSPKPPTTLQFKLPAPTAIGNSYATRRSTLDRLERCRLAYGAATSTSTGLKGFPRAVEVAGLGNPLLPGYASGRVFNLPLPSISTTSSSLDFCVFTNSALDPSTQLDCSWESICGLKDGSVPDSATDTPPLDDRSLGCEVRLIGGSRNGRQASLPCCTAPVPVTVSRVPPGYYWSGGAAVACEQGFFCPGGAITDPLVVQKQACPSGTTTTVPLASGPGADSLSDCSFVVAGWYWSDTAAVICPQGFYCLGGAVSSSPAKQPCPTTGTTTPPPPTNGPGADAASDCTWVAAGWSWSGTAPEVCEQGYYCPGGPITSSGIKQACPARSTTVSTGSTSLGQCILTAGSYYFNGAVSACPAGSYCLGGSATSAGSVATICPSDTTTASTGSSTVGQCLVPAGSVYVGNAVATCPSGSYCVGGSVTGAGAVASTCPTGSATPSTGASTISQCQCLAGYFGPTDGNYPCRQCPSGATSTAGSTTCLCAQRPVRTPWEMHEGGLEPGAMTFPYTVSAPCSTGIHGDICLYGKAVVPPTESTGTDGWKSAPDPEIIGFSRSSTVDCFNQVDYTYFQTFVHVPIGSTVTTFTIDMNTIDDGARITIYNSRYPTGSIVAGSYVYLNGSSTSNLASLVVEGVNRIVITQLDDCATGNNLRSATVTLNGVVVYGTCPT